LPELDAYANFIASHGHQAVVHDTGASVPANAQVVWWMCGRVSGSDASRLKTAFHIHEYASTSAPPHAWLKDFVKHWTQPKPDYRMFQNGWVRERMGFQDGVPHALRDMGVAQAFFDAAAPALPEPSYDDHAPARVPPNEFDLVFLGEMSRLLPFVPVLQSIHDAGRTLLLIGEVPDALRAQLPASVTCTGRVPHAEVPHQLRRARFGLNLVGNFEPYNQQTSTKLLEYCAVGLPVVATRVGGLPEVVLDGVTGRIVPPEDPDAMAEAIADLLRDDAQRRRLGATAREHVCAHHAWNENVARMETVYAGLICSSPGSLRPPI
jgi:glycosyltransferase involved in cell wall biosynthesis